MLLSHQVIDEEVNRKWCQERGRSCLGTRAGPGIWERQIPVAHGLWHPYRLVAFIPVEPQWSCRGNQSPCSEEYNLASPPLPLELPDRPQLFCLQISRFSTKKAQFPLLG